MHNTYRRKVEIPERNRQFGKGSRTWVKVKGEYVPVRSFEAHGDVEVYPLNGSE